MNTKPDVEGVVYTFFETTNNISTNYVFFFTDSENTLKILHRMLSLLGRPVHESDWWPAMSIGKYEVVDQLFNMLEMCNIKIVDISDEYLDTSVPLYVFARNKYNVYKT